MSTISLSPWRAYLRAEHQPLSSDSPPTQGRILLVIPGTPRPELGPNSHIPRREKWRAEDELRNATFIATRFQDVTLFKPGSRTAAYALITWERGRKLRDDDNADAALKTAYDVLERQHYIENDAQLHTSCVQVATEQRYGTTEILLVGELNPALPVSHVCTRIPLGTVAPVPGRGDEPHWNEVIAHSPGKVEDLLMEIEGNPDSRQWHRSEDYA